MTKHVDTVHNSNPIQIMASYTDNTNKDQLASTLANKTHSKRNSALQLADNRPEAITQRKLLKVMEENTTSQQFSIQKKENKTGLPNSLKSGIENLSAHSMDNVKVHYNSNKPAQLNAHAYAQGENIHLASGQEKHLPHEAWHVVQQKQGRVKPTLQLKGKVNINDDTGLEKEADIMGAKAVQFANNGTHSKQTTQLHALKNHNSIQEQITAQKKVNARTYQLAKKTKNVYKKPDLTTTIKNSRKDKLTLKSHYKSLGNAWTDLTKKQKKNMIEGKNLKPATIKRRRKILKNIKASKTEVMGEVNATNAILKNKNTWKLIFGFAKGSGF
ncbi:MAG: hypothetical protein ACI9DK_003013, partial [Vicingaceae bacterium]